jgi:hypothetical protein
MAASPHRHNLISLCLSGCKLITDTGVIALTKGCLELRVLKLKACPQVTGASLKSIKLVNQALADELKDNYELDEETSKSGCTVS